MFSTHTYRDTHNHRKQTDERNTPSRKVFAVARGNGAGARGSKTSKIPLPKEQPLGRGGGGGAGGLLCTRGEGEKEGQAQNTAIIKIQRSTLISSATSDHLFNAQFSLSLFFSAAPAQVTRGGGLQRRHCTPTQAALGAGCKPNLRVQSSECGTLHPGAPSPTLQIQNPRFAILAR